MRGKVVWITGSSSGIGKQLAIELAKHHVKLCISARSGDRLQAVKEECLKQSKLLQPNDILVLKMDMLDIDQHQRYFDTVVNHFGGLDILVNNAGRSQRASFEEINLSVDRELFELDVFSIVNLTRIYVRHCKGRGHVAVTSSSVGLISVPNSASYTAAKHAIHVGFMFIFKFHICPYMTNSFIFRVISKHSNLTIQAWMLHYFARDQHILNFCNMHLPAYMDKITINPFKQLIVE